MGIPSNEGEELAKLCEQLLSFKHNGNTREAIAHIFGVAPDSDEFFAAVSAIALRFRRFEEMIDLAPISDAHKQRAKAASTHLKRFHQTAYLNSSWQGVAKDIFTKTETETLFMLGPALNAVAPVIIPTEEERKDFIGKLQGAIDELDAASDPIGDMVKTALVTALRMIERFDIFGSTAIGEKLFVVHALTAQAEEIEKSGGRKTVYTRVAATVAMILLAFTQTDSILSAIENHYTRSQKVIQLLTTATPQKLLPSPESTNGDAREASQALKKSGRHGNGQTDGTDQLLP